MTSLVFAMMMQLASHSTSFMISTKAGVVNYVQGAANVKAATVAKAGKVISTGHDGAAEILLNPGSYLRMGADSQVILEKVDLYDIAVRIVQGSAVIEATGFTKDVPLSVTSGNLKMQIIKDGIYLFADGKVVVVEGKIRDASNGLVYGKGYAISDDAGYRAQKVKTFTTALELWSQQRDATIQAANINVARSLSQTAGVPFGSFQDVWFWYAPYGSFIYLPGGRYRSPYGYVYNQVVPPNYGGYGGGGSRSNGNVASANNGNTGNTSGSVDTAAPAPTPAAVELSRASAQPQLPAASAAPAPLAVAVATPQPAPLDRFRNRSSGQSENEYAGRGAGLQFRCHSQRRISDKRRPGCDGDILLSSNGKCHGITADRGTDIDFPKDLAGFVVVCPETSVDVTAKYESPRPSRRATLLRRALRVSTSSGRSPLIWPTLLRHFERLARWSTALSGHRLLRGRAGLLSSSLSCTCSALACTSYLSADYTLPPANSCRHCCRDTPDDSH